MIVTILGAPGNTGTKVVETLLKEDNVNKINILVHRIKNSSKLIRNFSRRDTKGELNGTNFWKHYFNLASGFANRVIGYETIGLRFETIGYTVEDFFDIDKDENLYYWYDSHFATKYKDID